MESSNNQRRWLIVLGMHRSGTSATAGFLESVGVDFGKNLFRADTFNPKGYWEHNELIQINEALLKELASCMYQPFTVRQQIAAGWMPSPLLRSRMRNLLQSSEYERTLCGLKDPRLSVLLPCWEPVFYELEQQVNCLIVYRNPQEVANSLLKRENLSVVYTEWMWAVYNLDVEINSRHHIRHWISYEKLLENPGNLLAEINHVFNLTLQCARNVFVEKQLRHYKNVNKSSTFPFIDKLFLALEAGSTPETWSLLQEDYESQLQNYLPFLNVLIQQAKDIGYMSKKPSSFRLIKRKIKNLLIKTT